MIKNEKYVEYYFDSKKHNESEIIENMKIEEIGFEKNKSEIDITLNEYGIYVVKLKFLNTKLSIINNRFIKKIVNENKLKKLVKPRKRYKGYETYNGNNKIYGQYKTTKTFEPI